MLARYHKILIGLLAAQLALVLVVTLRSGGTGPAQDHVLLPGFDVAKVTQLEITTSGDKPPIVLAKKGTSWVLASGYDYPVDEGKVSALLSPIAKMAAAEPIATQAVRHKQLRVGDDDYDRKIVITADGKAATLFVGGSTGTRRNAVRFSGDDDVYSASGISPGLAGTEPRDWIETAYVHFEPPEVTKMTVEHNGASLQLVREAASAPWVLAVDGTPVVEPLDNAAIDKLLIDLTSLEATAPGDPKRDVSKPAATITIGTKDKSIALDVLDDGTAYWVKQRDLPNAITTEKRRIDGALSVSREKLVVKPPPPGTGSGSGSGAGSSVGSGGLTMPAPTSLKDLPPDVQEQIRKMQQGQH